MEGEEKAEEVGGNFATMLNITQPGKETTKGGRSRKRKVLETGDLDPLSLLPFPCTSHNLLEVS